MQRRCAGMLLLMFLCGCQGMFGPQGLPPDPLFVTRKPIESKAKTGPPEATPFLAPSPPPNPYLQNQVSTAKPLLNTSLPKAASLP